MVHCCIPGCKNTHHNKSKKDEWSGHDTRNYSLHDLPSEDRMDIRELWVMAIHRSSLPKDVAVCSDHFTEDCFDEKWEEYKRKYGPTKVKRKLKLDAVPTIFPGRIFIHEKVQRIKENWKNKELQKQLEVERLRIEREYKDRFKLTQTECTCKCRCKLRKKNFSQQVNFQFKFMKDVGVQYPKDLTQTVKDDHSYTQGKSRTTKVNTTGKLDATGKLGVITTNSSTDTSNSTTVIVETNNSSCSATETADDAVERNEDEDEDEDEDDEDEEEEEEEEEDYERNYDEDDDRNYECERASFVEDVRCNAVAGTALNEQAGTMENGDFEVEIEYVNPPRVIVVDDMCNEEGVPPSQKRPKLDEFNGACT